MRDKGETEREREREKERERETPRTDLREGNSLQLDLPSQQGGAETNEIYTSSEQTRAGCHEAENTALMPLVLYLRHNQCSDLQLHHQGNCEIQAVKVKTSLSTNEVIC